MKATITTEKLLATAYLFNIRYFNGAINLDNIYFSISNGLPKSQGMFLYTPKSTKICIKLPSTIFTISKIWQQSLMKELVRAYQFQKKLPLTTKGSSFTELCSLIEQRGFNMSFMKNQHKDSLVIRFENKLKTQEPSQFLVIFSSRTRAIFLRKISSSTITLAKEQGHTVLQNTSGKTFSGIKYSKSLTNYNFYYSPNSLEKYMKYFTVVNN